MLPYIFWLVRDMIIVNRHASCGVHPGHGKVGREFLWGSLSARHCYWGIFSNRMSNGLDFQGICLQRSNLRDFFLNTDDNLQLWSRSSCCDN